MFKMINNIYNDLNGINNMGFAFKASDDIVYARGLLRVQMSEMVKFELEKKSLFGKNSCKKKIIIKRYYYTSNINYMFIIKHIVKKDHDIRNYTTNVKYISPKNIFDNHPHNLSLSKESFINNYDGENDVVYAGIYNYSHGPKYNREDLEAIKVGYDKNNNVINLILNKGELITLKDQNEANDYANYLETNYKDYDVTKNDQEIFNITNEVVLDDLKKKSLVDPISLTNKDMSLDEFTSLLRSGKMFENPAKFFDEFNKKF